MVLAGALAACLTLPTAQAQETLSHGRFTDVTLYRPHGAVNSFVLFLSGDGGWNQGVVGMAEALADEGALVAGISVPQLVVELGTGRRELRHARRRPRKPVSLRAELRQAADVLHASPGWLLLGRVPRLCNARAGAHEHILRGDIVGFLPGAADQEIVVQGRGPELHAAAGRRGEFAARESARQSVGSTAGRARRGLFRRGHETIRRGHGQRDAGQPPERRSRLLRDAQLAAAIPLDVPSTASGTAGDDAARRSA